MRSAAGQNRLEVFVETGTFRGDMVEAMRRRCRRVISIELDSTRYRAACERFARYGTVTILEGDSADVLPGVLAGITEPALFWLDGHYSGPGTARAEKDTPIVDELSHVLGHDVTGHVILVDDARAFDGTYGYPTLPELEREVRRLRPSASFSVEDDIIEIRVQGRDSP